MILVVSANEMPGNWSRRRVLLAGGGVASVALAGCSSVTGSDTPDTDAGNSQYGVVLENQTDESHEVAFELKQGFTPEPIWEKTVTVEAGESRNWNGVITREVEQQFIARLTEGFDKELKEGYGEDEKNELLSDSMWITPGSDSAPDVPDLLVTVQKGKVKDSWGGTMTLKNIDITYKGQETATTELPK